MPNILIIEDDAAFCQMLERFLTKQGYNIYTSYTAKQAKSFFNDASFDLVLTDLRLPDYDGLQLLSDIKKISPKTVVVVMTGYAEVASAVRAMKNGAHDYIAKPFTPEEMMLVITTALKNSDLKEKNDLSARVVKKNDEIIYGISEASQNLERYIRLVAPTDMSVLLCGESGTGKEVTARAIHASSFRKEHRFVAVDCGAIPKDLATSEFFGHLKGSFTGAVEDKIGHFEAANGGTLFLDEVGNLSYENQKQLLRALQERTIRRIGSTVETEVNLRIITATNEDLSKAVQQKTFREDLYHRLNEFSITIPSLHERPEDLPLFANHFLEEANLRLGKNIHSFSDKVFSIFQQYHWPGNLRELKNVIMRAALLSDSEQIETEALPQEVRQLQLEGRAAEPFSKANFEKEQIIKALKKTNFNKSKAAKLLQVTRKTLYNKINHYNLDF